MPCYTTVTFSVEFVSSVSLEEIPPAERIPAPTEISVPELEGRRQGKARRHQTRRKWFVVCVWTHV